jgi:protein required for attachment to host cells
LRGLLAAQPGYRQQQFVIDAIASGDGLNQRGRVAFPPCNEPEEQLMKPTITWVLIADGAEAKVFENAGPGKGLQPIKELHFKEEPLRASEMVADRSGSGIGSQGRGGLAPSSDPVAERERRFLEQVAERLERKHAEGAFDRLIIAAAPAALGDLRPALSKTMQKTIMAELPKDLTNVPNPQLEKHFEELLPV